MRGLHKEEPKGNSAKHFFSSFFFLFFSHIGTPNFPQKKKASHCGMVACDGRYFGDGLEAQFEIHTAKLRNKKPPVAATINANPSFSLNPSPSPLSL